MTPIHPDQLGALGPLTGGVVKPRPRTWDHVTGDGSLVEETTRRPELILGHRTFNDVTEIVCSYTEKAPGKWWLPTFGLVSSIAGLGGAFILYLIITGVGTWGLNNQVDW